MERSLSSINWRSGREKDRGKIVFAWTHVTRVARREITQLLSEREGRIVGEERGDGATEIRIIFAENMQPYPLSVIRF